ncbi:MAG: hypothetical protein C0443_02565 [Comamonadaceae bacterium]|nr:hypothetical protein [Comamonadaceae bacterium]
MSKPPVRRQAARTVLLVGEGDAEVVFLQHFKALYVQRGSGVAVTIKNARGKGAAHVVDFARRQSINAAYDVVAVLLDADTDWNDRTRTAAKRAKVHVLLCEPCLESLLLQVRQHPVEGRSALQLKQDFAARYGGPAHDEKVLRHFDGETLTAARARLVVLATLLALMGGQPRAV